MDFDECLRYATVKHSSQKRIGGDDYISHPIKVANLLKIKGFNEEVQVIGLFHDLLEDTNATKEEIINISNKNVYYIVKLLTKEKGYNIDEYIKRIKSNEIALNVKIADRIHNLQCAVVAIESFRKKYIVESNNYYFKLSILSEFYTEKEFVSALNNLENSIQNEFYCYKCNKWLSKMYLSDKRTGIEQCICKECFIKYKVEYNEFEDY